ncbi:MAG: hypothetical protein M0R66_00650 [Candidatus Omnitrophica bacterium]|nr:hypothetical protein [Candidatus Omnitrophota bacterium]
MAPKRIILMYISNISGHRSAAMAIEKALKALSPETEILSINAFHYTNPITEKIINRLYMSVIQTTPQIWEYLYDNPSVIKNLQKLKEAVHKFNSPKLKSLFEEFKPDIVACTQAFPCGMVADFKKAHPSNIKLLAVLTDYVPHSFWVYDTVDYYIAPSEEAKIRLIKKGIAGEKIKTLGIPFDPKFNKPVEKYEVYKKLGLDPGLPTILIMGGGHGLGPINAIVKSLEKIKMELQAIIVAGSNNKLYESLKDKTKKFRNNILVFGYVDNINELMDISSMIITKPGGITTAEVLTKKIPMLIVDPIPGQEANNARFLTEKKAAIQIDRPENVHLIVESLLINPDRLTKMRESAGKISKPNSSLDIAKLMLGL